VKEGSKEGTNELCVDRYGWYIGMLTKRCVIGTWLFWRFLVEALCQSVVCTALLSSISLDFDREII